MQSVLFIHVVGVFLYLIRYFIRVLYELMQHMNEVYVLRDAPYS